MQQAAHAAPAARITDPLEQRLRQSDTERARLPAEIALAALAGIALARSCGALGTLGGAPHAEVAELPARMLNALVG